MQLAFHFETMFENTQFHCNEQQMKLHENAFGTFSENIEYSTVVLGFPLRSSVCSFDASLDREFRVIIQANNVINHHQHQYYGVLCH